MTTFQSNIISLRRQTHLSQAKLAEAIEVKQRTYAAWETGRACPYHSTLLKLAAYFGVTVDVLLTDVPEVSTRDQFFRKYSTSPKHVKTAIQVLLKIEGC